MIEGSIKIQSVSADFTLDDDGNFTELSADASETTPAFVSSEFTLSDTQFYASRRS